MKIQLKVLCPFIYAQLHIFQNDPVRQTETFGPARAPGLYVGHPCCRSVCLQPSLTAVHDISCAPWWSFSMNFQTLLCEGHLSPSALMCAFTFLWLLFNFLTPFDLMWKMIAMFSVVVSKGKKTIYFRESKLNVSLWKIVVSNRSEV